MNEYEFKIINKHITVRENKRYGTITISCVPELMTKMMKMKRIKIQECRRNVDLCSAACKQVNEKLNQQLDIRHSATSTKCDIRMTIIREYGDQSVYPDNTSVISQLHTLSLSADENVKVCCKQ